jgi:hypothetical protein
MGSSFQRSALPMSLLNFRLPLPQPNLEFVTVVADEGKVRAVAQIRREIIGDKLPNADYHKDRLDIVERNLGVLAPIIQAKYDAGRYTDYTDSLGITSGNDKLIIIDRIDLDDIPFV